MAGIDISKLKTNGSHYALIGFTLPIYLDLPCQDYETVIEMNGKAMVIQMIFEKGEVGYFPDLPMPITDVTPRSPLYRKPIHYSSFLVYIPFRLNNEHSNRVQNDVWQSLSDNCQKFCSAAVSAVNNIIRTYRFKTGEIDVKPITLGDVLYKYDLALLFNKNDPNDSISEFVGTVVSTCNNDYLFIKRTEVPEEVTFIIRSEVAHGCNVPLSDELLLNAYDLFEQGNFRLAIIEAETAFESAIYQFLLEYYKSNAAVTSKVMEAKSFTTLLRYPESNLAIGLEKKEFYCSDPRRGRPNAGKNYVLWEQHVWALRGAIVHGRIANATYAEANKAIEVVQDLLSLLFGRRKTIVKRYSKLTCT